MVCEVCRARTGSAPSRSPFKARRSLPLIVLGVLGNSMLSSAQQKRATDLQHSSAGLVLTVSPRPAADVCNDQYAELKCSASVHRLSHWLGFSLQATSRVCLYFNFFLLVALIYWKAKPIVTAVAQERSMSIKRTIEESHRFGDEARSKLTEIENRWAQLDHEIAAIQASAETQMKQQEQLMLGETAADVHRILRRYTTQSAKSKQQSGRHANKTESICRKSSCFPRPTVNADR